MALAFPPLQPATGTPPAAPGTASPPPAAGPSGAPSPLFVAPPTLATFNELLGGTGETTAVPVEFRVRQILPAGSTNVLVQYLVPPRTVAMALSGLVGGFSFHSPRLTVQGWKEYGTSNAVPISAGFLPVVEDFTISRHVMAAAPITANLTLVFVNGTAYDITVTVSGIFLVVDEGRWNRLYRPFQDALATWIQTVPALWEQAVI